MSATPVPPSSLAYSYTHTGTEATTGYFSCEPPEGTSFEQGLAWLAAHPNDDFMHRFLLRLLMEASQEELEARAASAATCPVLAALLYEVCALAPSHAGLLEILAASLAASPEADEGALLGTSGTATPYRTGPSDENTLADRPLPHTSLPYIAWSRQNDRDLHRAWCRLFSDNIQQHRLLPLPEDNDLPPLYPDETATPLPAAPIAAIHAGLAATPGVAWQRPPAHETAQRALETLIENGIIAGVEMRHEASLSPIALLRRWQLDLSVCSGDLAYTLRGEATTYGRGLSLADARASYAMEMVERASSYASVGPEGVLGLTRPQPLRKARHSELRAEGITALDPNDIPLEVPYRDQPIHWLTGHRHSPEGPLPVLVPVQMVYLFCNLDEVALFTSSSSTGLASGNTLTEAKVAALTEILERDAEATTPYDRTRCFRPVTDDPLVGSLLQDYAARGINLQIQDMTTEWGVPCYTCFVIGPRGTVARGTGAGLDGRRALISALTETPYPYPGGAPSGPGLRALPERRLEDLPNFALESPERNLALLEETLAATGRHPVYVELTREDLGLPVVKAIIPGLELTADFDDYTRISRRLYRNYLRMSCNQLSAG